MTHFSTGASSLVRRAAGAAMASWAIVASVSAQPPVQLEDQMLLASDGAAGAWFGFAIAVSGDAAILGSQMTADNGAMSGSAYVFRRDALGQWNEEAKLLPDDGAAGDRFGIGVAIDGDTAVIGAWRDEDNGFRSGSAYVFEHLGGGAWVQTAKLLASNGDTQDQFGVTVAVDGARILVGSSRDHGVGNNAGAVYAFENDGFGNWTEVDELLSLDLAPGDLLSRVALSGDTAVLGAFGDDDLGLESGAAFVFRDDGFGNWSQVAKLLPADGAAGDRFGNFVALSGDTAVIGAPFDDDSGVDSGSVYVFVEDAGGVWHETAKLVASDGAPGDLLGHGVAIRGDALLAGAPADDDVAADGGSAYLFRRVGGAWIEDVKLLPSLVGVGIPDLGNFGLEGVALGAREALVGAAFDDPFGDDSGSAFVYAIGQDDDDDDSEDEDSEDDDDSEDDGSEDDDDD